ncbi:MAG: hypothetical protein ACTSU0_02440 [Alphaproteobacteria bacterium]
MAIRVVLVFFAVLVVVGMGIFAVLLTGPTEIGLVREQVIQTLQDGLGEGYRVQAGSSVIDLDPLVGGLVIRVQDIVITGHDDTVVARIPATTFAINPAKLLTLRLEVNAVELTGAELNFVRMADGTVKLGTGGGRVDAVSQPTPQPSFVSGRDGGFPDLIGPLQILDRGMEPPIYAAVRAGFSSLGLVDSTISVWDAASGQQRRFANSQLDISVDPDTSKLAVNFATLGYGGRWTASLERTLGAAASGHRMTAVFSQLTIADLLPGFSGDGPVSADIPLYGRATIDFDEHGDIQEANARLDFGAGVIRIAKGRETLLLDEATVRLRWDIPNRALIVDRSNFFFGETRGSIAGRIESVGDAANRIYRYNFISPGAVLKPRDTDLPPLIARRITFSGTYDPHARQLNIDDASIITDDGSVAAVGSLGFEGETPSLVLAASLSPMSIDTLKRIWVPLIEPGSRRYAIKNVLAGNIVSATFEASVPAGVLWRRELPKLSAGQMSLHARFENATIRTLGELPPITGASGNVVLSGSTLGIDLEGGSIETDSGVVTLDGGAFAIPDTSQRPGNGIVELQISGSAQALAEIADRKPLSALSKRNIAPSDLSGEVTASISLRVPLRPDVTDADVEWKIALEGRGLTSKVPVEGRNVSDADISIGVTPGEVTVYGRARIDGVEADVSMVLSSLSSKTAAPGARLVRLILDDEARRKLGVGLENMLSGSITALISDGDDGGQHFDLDLERARMTIPGVGWTKGIGVPARMTFDITPTEGGYAITNLVFQGDGFGFHGTAMLDESHALAWADIANLVLREGDEVAVKIARSANGFAINARGKSINLQGLLRQVRDRYDKTGGFPDLALDAEIDRVVGFNEEVISNAQLRLVSVGGETQKLSFAGNLAGAPISLDYATGSGGTSVNGGTTDTGRLMRFTDLYRNMQGGVAILRGAGGPNEPMVGAFEVTSFDVMNEPAMERMVAGQANASRGGGFNPRSVSFQLLVAEFIRDKRTITVHNALLRGAEIGATFSARYDVATTNVVATGTYLPAYAVNNLFGQIPILGLALGGGFREGLIGVTFKVEGPIAEPSLYFNPLSAVAPGIFRKIFEFQ